MAYGPLKVSILCPTFQQVALVARCVESLVAQKTSFSYEVLVRDDGSTDGTQEVLLDLQRRFPDKIRLMLEPENTFREVEPLAPLFAEASGQYFALCEGDDYWTDSRKLQVCIETIERDGQISLVGHLTECRATDPSTSDMHLSRLGSPGFYPRGELPRCHTSSIVARTQPFASRYSQLPRLTAGDLKLKVIAAELGASVVLDRVMSVYRLHANGFWQSSDKLAQATASLRDYNLLHTQVRHSGKSLAFAAAKKGRSDVEQLFRESQSIKALALWCRSLKTMRSAKARAVLLAPPGIRRIARVLQRR